MSSPKAAKRYERVARSISDAIQAGMYRPGERLPSERELALAYEVSRPTVREAVAVLCAQGILSSRQGAGLFVVSRRSNKASLVAVTEAQRLFESEAAAVAAAVACDDDVRELEQLVGSVSSVEGQRTFHLAVAGAAQNDSVTEVIVHLWDERSRLAGHVMAPTGGPSLYGDVCAAFRERDSARARQAVRAQWEMAIADLMRAGEIAEIARLAAASAARKNALMRRLV